MLERSLSGKKGKTKRVSAHKGSGNQFLDSMSWKQLVLLCLCSNTSGLPLINSFRLGEGIKYELKREVLD